MCILNQNHIQKIYLGQWKTTVSYFDKKKISKHRKIYEKLTFFNLNQILYIPMIKDVYSILVLYTIRYSNIPGIQLQLVLL